MLFFTLLLKPSPPSVVSYLSLLTPVNSIAHVLKPEEIQCHRPHLFTPQLQSSANPNNVVTKTYAVSCHLTSPPLASSSTRRLLRVLCMVLDLLYSAEHQSNLKTALHPLPAPTENTEPFFGSNLGRVLP